MFSFGGKGPDGSMYKDVYFLDLTEWICVPVNPISHGLSARFQFGSEIDGRKMVIHGGWDSASEVFDDLWIFNTDSFAWHQPKTSGFAPSPRFGHTITLTPQGK
jgi:host cell factor